MLAMLSYFFVLSLVSMMGGSWIFILLLMLAVYPFFFFSSFSFSFISKNMYLSMDLFSFLMIVLTFWIVILSVLAMYMFFESSYFFYFLVYTLALTLFLYLFFVSSSIFFFFFFFESTLFPTLYIIVGWGNNIERVQSGLYLFFYTLFGSMPMLMSIFYLFNLNNSLSFYFLSMVEFFKLGYLFYIVPFLLKMPMFLVHSWLPKAHVEAPVSGSMILAGILLKMGGYGMIRLSFVYKNYVVFNWVWIYISIWGGVVSSLICLRQVDLKSLIAYSSVAHMSLIIIGLLVYNDTSIYGCLMLMVAHGLCSSGLFFLANVVYERSGSRSLFINKGLMSIFPSLSIWWFLMASFNMSAPPSLNLLSEIFLFLGIVSFSFFSVYFLMLMCFFGGAYNLFLFSFCNHGKMYSNMYFYNACSFREYFVIYMHFFPISFFFLKLDLFY